MRLVLLKIYFVSSVCVNHGA